MCEHSHTAQVYRSTYSDKMRHYRVDFIFQYIIIPCEYIMHIHSYFFKILSVSMISMFVPEIIRAHFEYYWKILEMLAANM